MRYLSTRGEAPPLGFDDVLLTGLAPDGGLYLLDGTSHADTDSSPRIWALDRTFRAERSEPATARAVFQAVGENEDGDGRASGAAPVPSLSLEPQLRPQGVEALPDDTLLVLTVGQSPGDPESPEASRVHRYRLQNDGRLVEAGAGNLSDRLRPASADGTRENEGAPGPESDRENEAESDRETAWESWQAHDIAFRPGSPGPTQSVRGTLYVVGRDGNQAYALHLSGDADEVDVRAKAQYIPLHRFSGKAIVEAGGTVYYDAGDRVTAEPDHVDAAVRIDRLLDQGVGIDLERVVGDALENFERGAVLPAIDVGRHNQS